jgi:hypothetical protein
VQAGLHRQQSHFKWLVIPVTSPSQLTEEFCPFAGLSSGRVNVLDGIEEQCYPKNRQKAILYRPITLTERTMPNSTPPAQVARAPRWFAWLGLLALASYAAFLAGNTTVTAGGSDSSGYLNSARLLATGRLQGELRVPEEFGPLDQLDLVQFTPLGFFPSPNNPHLPPTYPPGLPLHFALAATLVGWTAGPWLVVTGSALAGVWLCYRVARELGLDRWLAAAGAVALAACPVFLFTSIQPLSDTLATTWSLAAVLAALRARRSIPWAAGCGLAFAMAVLVRPTNVLLLPALVVLIGLQWRKLAWLCAAGLPMGVWLGYYNNALYGGALRSGYGQWQLAFSLGYFWPTALHFGRWLLLLIPGVLLFTTIAAVFCRGYLTRQLLALGLWFGTIAGLYACYEVSREVWWCLRFILPAIPALILVGLLGITAWSRSLPPERRVRFNQIAAGVVVAWAVGASWHWTERLGVRLVKQYENVYVDAAIASRGVLPANALVVASHTSGAIYYYTENPILRWDQVDATQFARFAKLAQATGRSIYALIFNAEEKPALRERCPGDWTCLTTEQNLGLWLLTPPPVPHAVTPPP